MNTNNVKSVLMICFIIFISLNLMGLMDNSQNDLTIESN